MDERLYRFLKIAAIALAVVCAGWLVYDGFLARQDAAGQAGQAADRLFQDGAYEAALETYRKAALAAPELPDPAHGIAISLMQLDRREQALAAFAHAIALDPTHAGNYANRGILLDRMGDHQAAMHDYERALSLDPSLADGPGWLTRFLRNQAERPPSIADRLDYLRIELAKPAAERLLHQPDTDAAQRPYKKHRDASVEEAENVDE